MRIRFFQPTNERETSEFLELELGIRNFWQRFARVQHRPSIEWAPELRRELELICPALGLEVEGGGALRQMYVLAMDGPEYAPLARKMVAAAGEQPGWTITSERPALPLEVALARVASATRFGLDAARLKIGVDRGHSLSVVVGHYLFQGNGDELGGEAAELLVSTALGDATFERWISAVEVVPAPRPSPLKLVGQQDAALPLPLEELVDTITTAVQRITDTLPESPLHEFCERADWVLFEMDDLRNEDARYPLADLRVATTMCPEMLKSFLSGIPFASERFSRHGERFAYVEIDTRGQDQNQSLEQRTALEEALDFALVPGRLGCVVGAGVGETRMYVFLALHALEPALELVTRHLQERRLPKRTWVKFCDDEWRLEWIGAFPDSPDPMA